MPPTTTSSTSTYRWPIQLGCIVLIIVSVNLLSLMYFLKGGDGLLNLDMDASSYGFHIENDGATATAMHNDEEEVMFYILPIPELTTDLLLSNDNITSASTYYQSALNEESAEIWLHRGLQKLSSSRTEDPEQAHVIVICAYLHLYSYLRSKKDGVGVGTINLEQLISSKLRELSSSSSLSDLSDKTVLFTVPTWNPGVSNKIGIHKIMNVLNRSFGNDAVFSVGFERNDKWQRISDLSKILPIPYVLRTTQSKEDYRNDIRLSSIRINDFVFYAGDSRSHAMEWAGCDRRALTKGLVNATANSDVRLVDRRNRISQELYNQRMIQSDYCLLLCGDTPTSRSLTSAMVSGCIPIRVGSRLRGLCEAPCHEGFGWTVTNGDTHLPYSDRIDWNEFPEVNEAAYIKDSMGVLQRSVFDKYDATRKRELRSIMTQMQMKWIYGWGDPVTSEEFGDAVPAIWESFVSVMKQKKN